VSTIDATILKTQPDIRKRTGKRPPEADCLSLPRARDAGGEPAYDQPLCVEPDHRPGAMVSGPELLVRLSHLPGGEAPRTNG